MASQRLMELVLDQALSVNERLACEWLRPFQVTAGREGVPGFHLRYRGGVLRLCRGEDVRGVWVTPEELARRLQGTFLLGRACGVRAGAALEILDATAGLGTDGFALALAGARVTLVEREQPLWAMIHDLRRRLEPSAGSQASTTVVLGDCADILGDGVGAVADVVYFDPMFPVRGKSALPGKRMQYLAELLAGSAEIGADLVEHARSRVRARVVVKRRRRDPSFGKPDWAIRGRSVRYDVYAACGRRGR